MDCMTSKECTKSSSSLFHMTLHNEDFHIHVLSQWQKSGVGGLTNKLSKIPSSLPVSYPPSIPEVGAICTNAKCYFVHMIGEHACRTKVNGRILIILSNEGEEIKQRNIAVKILGPQLW
jgi:hypothetical protein